MFKEGGLHQNLMSDDFLLKFGSPSTWLGLQHLELQISHFSVLSVTI